VSGVSFGFCYNNFHQWNSPQLAQSESRKTQSIHAGLVPFKIKKTFSTFTMSFRYPTGNLLCISSLFRSIIDPLSPFFGKLATIENMERIFAQYDFNIISMKYSY